VWTQYIVGPTVIWAFISFYFSRVVPPLLLETISSYVKSDRKTWGFRVMVFNATFNYISMAASFIGGGNHRPAASH
jgi:hypothetical protein